MAWHRLAMAVEQDGMHADRARAEVVFAVAVAYVEGAVRSDIHCGEGGLEDFSVGFLHADFFGDDERVEVTMQLCAFDQPAQATIPIREDGQLVAARGERGQRIKNVIVKPPYFGVGKHPPQFLKTGFGIGDASHPFHGRVNRPPPEFHADVFVIIPSPSLGEGGFHGFGVHDTPLPRSGARVKFTDRRVGV